jgi:hypothetical protein
VLVRGKDGKTKAVHVEDEYRTADGDPVDIDAVPAPAAQAAAAKVPTDMNPDVAAAYLIGEIKKSVESLEHAKKGISHITAKVDDKGHLQKARKAAHDALEDARRAERWVVKWRKRQKGLAS